MNNNVKVVEIRELEDRYSVAMSSTCKYDVSLNFRSEMT